ncbi:hypothetical protein BsWGS_13183 [Bradybaena similaris]
MCATVVTCNFWHPVVLNLLPFSKNDAAALSRDSVPAPGTMSHQLFPSLPVLAVSLPFLEPEPSSNNGLSSHSSGSSSTAPSRKTISSRSKQTILTASSDKGIQTHSRRLKSRVEMTSDNGWVSSNSKDLDSTKFSLNVNGQLRKASEEDSLKADVNQSLPKPVFKPTEYWKLHDHKRKYRFGNQGKGLERHTRNMDLEQSSGFQLATRRVKVNVKELPRSRTPIAENDPDRLNMNHVIAFLQANKAATGNGYRQKSVDAAQLVSSGNPGHLPKRLSLSSALPHARRKEVLFDKQQQMMKIDPNCDPNSMTALVKATEISPERCTSSRRTSCNSESSSKTVAYRSIERVFRHPSPRSWHARGGIIYQHGSKVVHVDVSQHADQSKRSTTFVKRQMDLKASDKQLFPNACKSRNNSAEMSYRLNRYRGPEKNETKSVVSMPSGLQDHQGCLADSAKDAWKSASNAKDVGRHSQLQTCSSLLPSVRSFNSKSIYRKGLRSHSKHSNISCIETERTSNRNTVICLPTAQLEADSEEDSLLPSNVGRVQSEPDVVLPAKERGIIQEGVTPSSESNSNSNSTTAVQHCVSVSGLEPAQDDTNTVAEIAVLNEKTDDTLHFQTVQTKLNELSLRLAEHSLDIPGQSAITVADITEGRTSREELRKFTNTEANQKTLSRCLSDDQSTLARTRHWLENHSKLFPPLISKHKHPDEPQVPTRSSEQQIRFSLRKERNKTRVHTYMADMGERHGEP